MNRSSTSLKSPETCESWGRMRGQLSVPRDASTPGGLTTTYEGSDRMTKRTCSFPDCSKPYEARGLCASHYMQQRRGRQLSPIGSRPHIIERLSACSQPDGDCLLWAGKLSEGGYGQIRWDGERWYVHRAAYFVERGEIPDGMQVNHICGNRACISIAHLELVTHYQNTQYLTRLTKRNTSGYRGVSFNKSGGRYQAKVVANGVSHCLGSYESAEDAARAALEGRERLHSIPEFNTRIASAKTSGGNDGDE